MIKLTGEEIAKVVGGRLIGNGNITVNNVTTDSRAIPENALFIALSGDKFNGNDYVLKALDDKAKIAIADREINYDGNEKAVIITDNTLKAMHALALYIRNKFNIKLVGVTGSVGKTTTKEMIYSVLSAKYNTHKTMGNFNNDIGLPLSIFKLDKGHEAAVIEMGMSNLGEIETLTKIACPTAAVITNIGISHIENLKTRDNILKAKMEITKGLAKDGFLVLNADDEYLSKVKSDEYKIIRYGIENECDVRGQIISDNKMRVMGEDITLPVPGVHNMYNALAAIAVGLQYGITVKEAAKQIAEFKTDERRQHEVSVGNINIICDYYNANPQSVEAGLFILCKNGANRKIAVLGDMLELGEYSKSSHEKIGDLAVKLGVDALFCYGDMTKYTVNEAKKEGLCTAKHFSDKKELAKDLLGYLKNDDRVLIKGSRGMKMEEIYEVLCNELGN